jgi:hypothetical protein
MDPYTQVLDKILTIIVTLLERDKAMLAALPENKRAEMALAQYEDWKGWRDFWVNIFSVFKPKL